MKRLGAVLVLFLSLALTACSGESTPDAGSGQATPKEELTADPAADACTAWSEGWSPGDAVEGVTLQKQADDLRTAVDAVDESDEVVEPMEGQVSAMERVARLSRTQEGPAVDGAVADLERTHDAVKEYCA